jgi:hypothetical protein
MNPTLAQVGEFGLIDQIHEIIQKEGVKQPESLLGIGDDCAAFQPRPNMTFWSPAIAWWKRGIIYRASCLPMTWGAGPWP